jgi:hypothetical protein
MICLLLALRVTLRRRNSMSEFGGTADVCALRLQVTAVANDPKQNIGRTIQSIPGIRKRTDCCFISAGSVQRNHSTTGTTGLKSGAVLSPRKGHDTRRWNHRSRGQEAIPQSG